MRIDEDSYEEEKDLEDHEMLAFTQHLTQSVGEKCNFDLSQKSFETFDDDKLSQMFDARLSQSIEYNPSDDEEAYGSENLFQLTLKRKRRPDTEDRVTINGRRGLIVMNKGEAFKLKKDNGKIYVVERFIIGSIDRKALCRVYEKLEYTFIGKKYTKTPRNFTHTMGQNPVVVFVRELGEKIDENLPATSLLYDAKCLGCGNRFEITYTFIKENMPQEYDTHPRTVLDLFCGAGGMSEGFKRHGFLVKWGVDSDPSAATTYRLNHPNGKVFLEDIRDFMVKVREGRVPSYSLIKPDHIHASPPCQAFSLANRTGGKNDEKNAKMTLEFIEAVKFFKPPTVSMENVTGLLRPNHKIYLQKVVVQLIAMEYQVRVFVLDSSSYGDAQKRERVFLFGARRNIHQPANLPDRPEETHGRQITQRPFRSSRDALHDLENIAPGTGIQVMEDGRTEIEHHTLDSITLKSEFERLNPDEPASTVRGGNSFRHYAYDRSLTSREYARLQGFPDSHVFSGSVTSIRKQIGNAVPCNLASAVAFEIKKSFFPDLLKEGNDDVIKKLWI